MKPILLHVDEHSVSNVGWRHWICVDWKNKKTRYQWPHVIETLPHNSIILKLRYHSNCKSIFLLKIYFYPRAYKSNALFDNDDAYFTFLAFCPFSLFENWLTIFFLKSIFGFSLNSMVTLSWFFFVALCNAEASICKFKGEKCFKSICDVMNTICHICVEVGVEIHVIYAFNGRLP